MTLKDIKEFIETGKLLHYVDQDIYIRFSRQIPCDLIGYFNRECGLVIMSEAHNNALVKVNYDKWIDLLKHLDMGDEVEYYEWDEDAE